MRPNAGKTYLTEDRIKRFESFYHYLKRNKYGTAAHYLYILDKFPQGFLDSLEVKGDAFRIKQYIYDQRPLPGEYDLKRNYNIVRAALKKYLYFTNRKDVADYLEPPVSKKRQDISNQHLSNDAIDGIIEHLPTEDAKMLYKTLQVTGMRVIEAITLTPKSINWDKKTIWIDKLWAKNKVSRQAFINQRLRDELLAYITAKNLKENERLFVFPKTKGLVNTDVKENRVLEYMSATQQKNIARWMLRKTGEELGYEKLHPHMFRHSLGFNLRQQGWRMEDIQVVLGHSSISTTGIYATADNKKIHEEFEKTIK